MLAALVVLLRGRDLRKTLAGAEGNGENYETCDALHWRLPHAGAPL